MNESSKNLILESNRKNDNNESYLKESREIFILALKITSFILLSITLIFQFQFLLYFILNSIINDIYFIILLILIFYIILLRFIVQSFLYILQCPFLKSFCFYTISCSQFRDLLEVSIEFTNLYKNVKKQNKIFDQDDVLVINEISNVINSYLIILEEIKQKGALSQAQSDLYEALTLWKKNYKEYKNKKKVISTEKMKNENKNFMYFLGQMSYNSNQIIKILRNFICDNYQILSFKKLYNCFISKPFLSLEHYSILFQKKFNGTVYSFVTSDNKIIDYIIITYDRLNKVYKKTDNNTKNIKKENSNNKNLVIFCNPNGMIYQLYTPEKFLFLLEGGSDILLWNYRGYGYSTGYPTFKNAKTDVVELFDYIKKKNLYKKYGAYGYSVGGGSATFLCKNRNLDVLICDRNYTDISTISRDINIFGEFLYYLSKILYFKYDNNVTEFMKSKNIKICKVVLCDPEDEIIPNSASLKSGISKYIIKEFCIENSLKITENILDLFLNIENNINQKNDFIKSLLYIMDIWIEFNKNPFKDLVSKKNKSSKKEDKLDKSLLINITENMEINNKNFRRKLVNTIVKFFKCFNYSSENLEAYKELQENRLKIIHIDTYFNNFFIWGSISRKKIKDVDGFSNPFDIKNNSYYLNNSIDTLNEFVNDKFIKSMLNEESNKEKYNHMMIIKNCFQIFKNKTEFSEELKKINIGSLIRLDCGHNGMESEVDKKNLIDILKSVDFIK